MKPNKVWANICINHEYLGGKCSDFKFIPDNTTKDRIIREGFLVSETSEGFLLIAEESNSTEKIHLRFWAYPTRQELWSITLFKGITKGSIPLAKATEESLHWEKILESEIPKEISTPKPMFGLEFIHPRNATEKKIALSLKTKKMKWRYNISGLSEFGEVEIIGFKGSKETSQFDAFMDPSGIIVFTSKKRIPLRYGAAPRFQLHEKKTSRTIIKCLPNMDARSIAMNILDDGKQEPIAETFFNT